MKTILSTIIAFAVCLFMSGSFAAKHSDVFVPMNNAKLTGAVPAEVLKKVHSTKLATLKNSTPVTIKLQKGVTIKTLTKRDNIVSHCMLHKVISKKATTISGTKGFLIEMKELRKPVIGCKKV